jgi:NADPH:quinone reductase-like Zn-dependent oxidoreductase
MLLLRFGILGGISAGGTFTEFIAVDRKQVIIVPDHLPLVYAAAWPVAGVTSWRYGIIVLDSSELNVLLGLTCDLICRAVKIKADVKVGDNVLIVSNSIFSSTHNIPSGSSFE